MPDISISEPGRQLFQIGFATRVVSALIYGVKIAAAVSAALYAAFFLQLDQPTWAGITAAIVAQPVLGAALRKGMFRLIGTLAGAAAAVVIVILFPQSRVGFFLGLAFWGGLCGYAATALRNFAGYGAIIAGFTTAVVALNSIHDPNHVLTIALSRASSITLGIVATTLIFSLTDFGAAREDLARRIIHISQEIVSALFLALRFRASPLESSRAIRRALLAEAAGLDAILDEAIGESSTVRARAAALQAALSGLFSAMSCWRAIEAHLNQRPRRISEAGAEAVLMAVQADALPEALGALAAKDPALLRDKLHHGGRALLDLPATTASARLLLDQTGKALIGLAKSMNGIALLRAPATAATVPAWPIGRTYDPMVAILNGLRVSIAIVTAAIFWVYSHWSDGPLFITFVMIVSLFYTTQNDQASDVGLSFTIACVFAAAAALVLKFVLLPSHESFVAFSLLLGAFVVPGGALSTVSGRPGSIAFLYAVNTIAMLAPTNRMVFDLSAFFNNALAIVAGTLAGVAGYKLIPPLSPELRARRQLDAALRELRRLANGHWRPSVEAWEDRLYNRMIAQPKAATPLQRGRLVTVLGVGLAILQLQDIAALSEVHDSVHGMLSGLAAGNVEQSRASADAILDYLASKPIVPDSVSVQRLYACVREIEEAIAEHAEFFSGRG